MTVTFTGMSDGLLAYYDQVFLIGMFQLLSI
jgi:hypothetical protein